MFGSLFSGIGIGSQVIQASGDLWCEMPSPADLFYGMGKPRQRTVNFHGPEKVPCCSTVDDILKGVDEVQRDWNGEQIPICYLLAMDAPKTNRSPLTIGFPKRKVVSQPPIFRGYVSFREGIHCIHILVDCQNVRLAIITQSYWSQSVTSCNGLPWRHFEKTLRAEAGLLTLFP